MQAKNAPKTVALCASIESIYTDAVSAYTAIFTAHTKLQAQCSKITDIVDMCEKIIDINTGFVAADAIIRPVANLVPGALAAPVKVLVAIVDPIITRIKVGSSKPKQYCNKLLPRLKLLNLKQHCQQGVAACFNPHYYRFSLVQCVCSSGIRAISASKAGQDICQD